MNDQSINTHEVYYNQPFPPEIRRVIYAKHHLGVPMKKGVSIKFNPIFTANNRRSGGQRFNDILFGRSNVLYGNWGIPRWLFRNWM